MQIQSIELTNFRSFAGAVVPLTERVTFLVGRNHAGKSSVIDALTLTLTGQCRGTSADGKGAESLIRDGAPAMRVRLQVATRGDGEPGFTVERMQNAKMGTLAIGGVVGTRHDASTQLLDRFGCSPAVINACLNSEAFLDLHHASAKTLLMEILDVRVPVDGTSDPLTLEEIDRRYKHWMQERPARKKALDAIRLPAPPEEGQLPDVAELATKLAALREDEKALIAQTSQDAGRRGAIVDQIATLEAEQARLTERLTALGTAVALDGARLDLQDAIDELEERLAQAELTEGEQAAAEEAQQVLVTADGRLRLVEDTIAGLKAHAPDRGCVLNAEIECRTPAKLFQSQLKKIAQQVEELRAEKATAVDTVASIKARLEEQHARERRLQALTDQRTQRDDVAAAVARLTQQLQGLMRQRDQLPAIDDAGPRAEVEAVRTRIVKGERVIADVRDQAKAREAYATAHKQQQAAAAAWAEAERNCDLYGPKGARVKALAAALDRFHADINVALQRFGYQMRIVPDPWLVLVNGRPAELLSRSERLLAGIALQLAIAEMSGFGFVAIDQVDLFDGEHRRSFGALLDVAPVQVLAAMTRDDDFTPPANDWSWLRIVDVDGASTVQPCGEAVMA